jgi:ribosomal protein S18 acetylase RimI-like enzyme
MNFRTAVFEDWPQIKALHQEVSKQKTGIARWEHEVTDEYVQHFMKKALENGLMIVGVHPQRPEELIAEIHACKNDVHVFRHLMNDLTIAIHPDFQGKKIGRTLFTIFLEEIALHHPDIGKIQLVTRESNLRALKLYQSLGFRIEGRLEMQIRTPDGNFEADIPMGWTNPNFEFEDSPLTTGRVQ